MDILYFRRAKLLQWMAFSSLFAWFGLTRANPVWAVVGVIAGAFAVRALYLAVVAPAALRCEPDGLVVNSMWPKTIRWTHFQGADVQKTTSYVLGFIPVARSYALVFKSRRPDGFFTGKSSLALSLLDARLEDIPVAMSAIGRYAMGHAATPAADASPAASFGSAAAAIEAAARAAAEARDNPPPAAAAQPAQRATFGRRRAL